LSFNSLLYTLGIVQRGGWALEPDRAHGEEEPSCPLPEIEPRPSAPSLYRLSNSGMCFHGAAERVTGLLRLLGTELWFPDCLTFCKNIAIILASVLFLGEKRRKLMLSPCFLSVRSSILIFVRRLMRSPCCLCIPHRFLLFFYASCSSQILSYFKPTFLILK
jgi:hypothetical protein